jgi:DME family drug/metabolite transporter
MRLLGELAALGGALTWALGGVLLTRVNRKVNVMAISAVRCLSASLFFYVLLLANGVWESLLHTSLATIAGLLLSVMIVLGAGDSAFFVAAKRIGMVRAMPITMTYPLFTMLLAAIFLHERLSLPLGIGAGLILAGIYLLSSGERAAPAARPNPLGIGLALTAALLWAIGTVILAPISQGIDPIAANCIRQPAAALLFLAVMPKPQGIQQLKALAWHELGTLVLAGVLASGLGAWFYLISLRSVGASVSAVLTAASPVFSTPLSVLLLGEKVNLRLAAGTVLIIAGVWLVILG